MKKEILQYQSLVDNALNNYQEIRCTKGNIT